MCVHVHCGLTYLDLRLPDRGRPVRSQSL